MTSSAGRVRAATPAAATSTTRCSARTRRATLALDPKVAKKTKLPPFEIARVDPLRVLPPLRDAGIAWNWGAR